MSHVWNQDVQDWQGLKLILRVSEYGLRNDKEENDMNMMSFRNFIVILAHAFVGWALCGAIMFVGMEVTSLQTTLIAHAIGAPIIFAAAYWIYFRKFNYTTPLQTAIVFVTFVILMDFFVVALLIKRSIDMFLSWLGTWLPFVLIFSSTYITGLYLKDLKLIIA